MCLKQVTFFYKSAANGPAYLVNQHWGTCALLKCSESVIANPPNAGLVNHILLVKVWTIGIYFPSLPIAGEQLPTRS